MSRMILASRVAQAARVLLVAAIFTTACSSGDPEQQNSHAEQTRVSTSQLPGSDRRALVVSPRKVWGHGRALQAIATAAGAHVVVSTTGIYLAAQEREPVVIQSFDSEWDVAAIAISPDETTLMVAIGAPARVQAYELGAGRLVGSHQLPIGADVRSLTFVGSRIVIDTSAGPFVAPDVASAPQPLLDTQTTGRSADLPDGTLVTPISGTSEIGLHRQGVTERRPLAVQDGSRVVDARSSPTGSTVGVSITTPESFDEGEIAILDATTFEPRLVIDVPHQLEFSQWLVTESAVVAAAGSAIEVRGFDGSETDLPAPASTAIVALHPIAGGFLSVHTDGAVVRWSTETWTASSVAPGGTTLQNVALDATSARLTTVDYFGLITTWSVSQSVRVATDVSFMAGEATDVAIAADGRRVGASLSSGQVVMLNDALDEEWAFQPSPEREFVGAIGFDPVSGELVTGLAERLGDTAFDDAVTVWDPNQRVARFSIGGESDNVAGCAFYYSRVRFDPDRRLMAVSSHDFSVVVADVASGAVLHELPGSTTVLDLGFSPDGRLLVATYDNGTVTVWDTTNFSQSASYQGAQGGYFAIRVMPDNATMAAVDITGAITLVDIVTGAVRGNLRDSAFRTSTMALSSDGSLVAAPAAGGAIAIWSTSTGNRLAIVNGHTADVTGIAFAPSGEWLASVSRDGTVRTWTVTSEA